jgi:hypothetical protein
MDGGGQDFLIELLRPKGHEGGVHLCVHLCECAVYY